MRKRGKGDSYADIRCVAPFITTTHVTICKLCLGQRIVARLRERTYGAAIRQEVEFVERGEGDVISRLSTDSSIVGER